MDPFDNQAVLLERGFQVIDFARNQFHFAVRMPQSHALRLDRVPRPILFLKPLTNPRKQRRKDYARRDTYVLESAALKALVDSDVVFVGLGDIC